MPEGLNTMREQAESRFQILPFPSSKDENFRFTVVDYRPGDTGTAISSVLPSLVSTLDAAESAVLLLNGGTASLLGEAPGIQFANLAGPGAPLPASGDELFYDDKFAQLTSARWQTGAYIHVPAGIRVEKPIRFVICPHAAETHFCHQIVLEEGAEAVVVQEGWSGDSAHFLGELVEVKLGRNSKLHWVVLQQFGRATDAVVRQRLDIGEGAELRFTPLHAGGRLVQVRQEVHLSREGVFETQGAARGDQSQHFDFWLDVRHDSARSRSNMDYWFVMAEKAKGVFNGQVEVKQAAPGCESSQRSKTLLLGTGSVHAIPKLLIKTDDVKCSHGASVSSVSFEQLHYLQSRGIPRRDAEKLIIRGFTAGVVERFPTEALRARAEALLEAKQGGPHE